MQKSKKEKKDYINNSWSTLINSPKSSDKKNTQFQVKTQKKNKIGHKRFITNEEKHLIKCDKSFSHKKPIPVPAPTWVKSTPTSIIISNLINSNVSLEEEKILNENNIFSSNIPLLIKKKIIRNQISRLNKNISHDAWEYVYFEHILNLYNIFSEVFKKLNLNIDTDSFDFLYNFSLFIKDCSSGEISPYIENLSDNVNTVYLEYTIKRDNF